MSRTNKYIETNRDTTKGSQRPTPSDKLPEKPPEALLSNPKNDTHNKPKKK